MSQATCHEWYQRFQNGHFHVEDWHSGERPKVFDEELDDLLDEDLCQTQEELSKSLGWVQNQFQNAKEPENDPEVRILGVKTERCLTAFLNLCTIVRKTETERIFASHCN